MSEMIERVAKALFEEWLAHPEAVREQAQNGPHPPWCEQGDIGKDRWLRQARAAIKEMGHPTDRMWKAGEGFSSNEFAYRSMIVAALKDD